MNELRIHYGSGLRIYFGQMAQNNDLGRESLYKTLSESGNPPFSTIDKILRSLGLKLSITTADKAYN